MPTCPAGSSKMIQRVVQIGRMPGNSHKRHSNGHTRRLRKGQPALCCKLDERLEAAFLNYVREGLAAARLQLLISIYGMAKDLAIAELRDQIGIGRVVPVIGAGVSKAVAKYPGWIDLVEGGIAFAEASGGCLPQMVSDARTRPGIGSSPVCSTSSRALRHRGL